MLEGRSPPLERTFHWRTDYPSYKQKAVRAGRWKYLRDGGAVMLFDVDADPGERRDLSYHHPDIVADLERRLSEWEAGLPGRPPGA